MDWKRILILTLVSLVMTCFSAAGFICRSRINARANQNSTAVVEVKTKPTEAVVAFIAAYSVFSHPRCMNCHPAGNAPLQGDDSHPHAFRVQRGPDGNGVTALRCSNCHQATNASGAHAPPGAPFPAETKESLFKPRWHLPTAKMPLVFEGRTAGQLCRQLKDRNQNGGLSLQQLLQHVSSDPLVLWGWNPGEGRTTPPMSHEEFVAKVNEWINNGAACPK